MHDAFTINATLKAWVTSGYNMRSLLDALREGEHQQAAEHIVYSNCNMDQGSDPWTLVGEATLSVQLCSRDEMVRNQLTALNAELEHARAQWLTKQREILERISKLQALTNEVST